MMFRINLTSLQTLLYALLGVWLLSGCGDNQQSEKQQETNAAFEYASSIKELDKAAYPDNPDWGNTHAAYASLGFSEVKVSRDPIDMFRADLEFFARDAKQGSLRFQGLNLYEWMPSSPKYTWRHPYLYKLGVINQEWNRHQVRFDKGGFEATGVFADADIRRVDIARNCLNSYLWEIIVYAYDSATQKVKPFEHGWFDFPHAYYEQLFARTNPIEFDSLREYLVDWKDPESEVIDLALVRDIQEEKPVTFKVLNEGFYPMEKARKSKYKNIIYPASPTSMQQFLIDSTLYATFTPPGFYNTSDPRKTQLSLLAKPSDVKMNVVKSKTGEESLWELDVRYADPNGKTTRLVVGGIRPKDIPILPVEKMNDGYKMPMGFGNHSFYETYAYQQEHPIGTNPYYGILLDEAGKWLDSHSVGIDGPLLHFDESGKLHFWVLSFERHSFVTHLELTPVK